jgi:hypothetical protein
MKNMALRNIMAQIDICLKDINPLLRADTGKIYANPTILFSGTIRNADEDKITLVHIQFTISIFKPEPIILGVVPLTLINIPNVHEEAQNFSFILDLYIDSLNEIHKMISGKEYILNEKIQFSLSLDGFSFCSNNLFQKAIFINTEHIVKLHVTEYLELLSKYYHDFSWIPISRDTYRRLRKYSDETGFLSLDETIDEIISLAQDKGHHD